MMLTPDMLLLYRGHADEDDSGFFSIHAVRDLFDHIDAQEGRIAALETAVRATIAVAEYQSIDRELECLLCLVERGAHEATCPVGALAALLEAP